ncbi:relaxin receptor 2-like [Babylonia areolata]|uniref:relaxin receptor 2-like n=1 Tax=Babylonia areolata TaxID=304850 RepID=UPI003FD0F649
MNGQCVSFENVCDQMPECLDESDEKGCAYVRSVHVLLPYFPSPAFTRFDGLEQFISVRMNSSESCPDSHYRCPGEFNDCMPVYTRCNGMYDCKGHEDEERCTGMSLSDVGSHTYLVHLVLAQCSLTLLTNNTSSSGFSVFVTNLTISDSFMGVYITVIGQADERFRGIYLHHDDTWKNSVTCKIAGFLSLLSSEVSALIIWLITLDRFLVLRFPFSTLRFEKQSAMVTCLFTWLIGWFLALLPLLPMTSHWEFYSQTGICIPLPITRMEFKGKSYSFGVLIVMNFILFLLISAGQTFVYWSIQNNSLKTDTTRVSRDMTVARRLISVAVTDFVCWFPIGLCGILASAGTPIPGEMSPNPSGRAVVFTLALSKLSSCVTTFDGLEQFISVRMNSSESCPDSHYRCPGEFNDCMPVYTRCNGMYDCKGHEDEEGFVKSKVS